MTTVHLPRSLELILPGLPRQTQVDGTTVREVIAALDDRWPGVADRLLEGSAIRRHINVFVDGETAQLGTPVTADATVHIIPAIAGGGPWPLEPRLSETRLSDVITTT
jgi:molybdopterin synthase sulfur carrier subunit